MKHRNLWLISALAGCVGLILSAISPAGAVPPFARKYGFNCTMCHSNYPRLNDFGQRYRSNGYQLPGREDDDKTVLETTAPFGARTSVGFNHDSFKRTEGAEDVSQFQLNGLDLLSAGLFGRNAGYLMVYLPQINGSSGVVEQEGTLEMASVAFSNLGSPWLNVRVGRFEPAYVAFSTKRQLTFSPYEAYDFAFPGGPALADTQSGIEITGHGNGFSYAAGWTDGSSTNRSGDSPQDFYVRAAKVFGAGEGQTAGQKIGVMGYFGKARPQDSEGAGGKETFQRWGVDASLNYDHFNLAMQYVHGKDDATLWQAPGDLSFSGYFAELSYLPSTDLVAFARYDRLDVGNWLGEDVDRWTIGGRRYLADNLAIHVEYSHRQQDLSPGSGGSAREEFLTARLDVAF